MIFDTVCCLSFKLLCDLVCLHQGSPSGPVPGAYLGTSSWDTMSPSAGPTSLEGTGAGFHFGSFGSLGDELASPKKTSWDGSGVMIGSWTSAQVC